MSNVTVQEALKSAIRFARINPHVGMYENSNSNHVVYGAELAKTFEAALADIDKCEPVGELILDPVFLPALKAPLVNWKINLVDLEVGTKFYTSPQPRDCEPVITNTNHGFVMTDRNFTYAGNGYIQDNNFDHDAALKISGDFAEGDLDKYAQMIVKQLNTKG